MRLGPASLGKLLGDGLVEGPRALFAQGRQAQRAERHADPVVAAAVADRHQLQAAAAKVCHHAMRAGKGADHPHG